MAGSPLYIKILHVLGVRLNKFPPLYKLEKNKKVWYAYSDEELNQILTEVGPFRIFPRRGRIACVARERAVFAEPPAESPSTM